MTQNNDVGSYEDFLEYWKNSSIPNHEQKPEEFKFKVLIYLNSIKNLNSSTELTESESKSDDKKT